MLERLLLGCCVACAAASPPALAQSSATARFFPDGPTYVVPTAPNRLAAAGAATAQCRSRHAAHTGYCELVALDGRALTTSAALRAAMPQNTHPLYLWRFEDDDTTVFVAGSIHLLKPGFYPLPPQFDAAFALADVLALEIDTARLSAEQIQQTSFAYGTLPDDATLATVLPEDVYRTLDATLAEYGAPLEQLARFKPNMIVQQLGVFALMSVGYDPTAGMELYFRSRVGEREVRELESLEFQLDLLFNAPMSTQIAMTRSMLEQMSEFESLTAELMGAWLAGDDATFIAATQAQQGDLPEVRAFNDRLIKQRNASMAGSIETLFDTPRTFFVLVGAAHLLGPDGIPALLERRGLRGARLQSDSVVTATPTP